jgi:peptidoglycan-N-acetylglucosamine deacetylase
VQLLGLGVVRSGNWKRPTVALTFDDGPDPATTPAVLDALEVTGVQVTFFVLVPKAKAHPALMARMQAAGHQIELHAIQHRHAWLRWPWSAYLDVMRGARELQVLTGQRPRFHRPPHGAYSLAVLLAQRRARLIGAHWSVDPRDWLAGQVPAEISDRVLAHLHPGAVVLLHDAGPGAYTSAAALPGLLRELAARGYEAVRLDELPGALPLSLSGLPRRLAGLFDTVFDRLGRIRPLLDRADSLYRLARIPFPFEGVTLSDGVPLEHGAPVLELHVNNPLMVDTGLTATLRRLVNREFPLLAHELRRRPGWQGVQAVCCTSALSPLLERMGFESLPLPSMTRTRLRVWANILRRVYGSPARAPEAKLSMMSRGAFLERYGEP